MPKRIFHAVQTSITGAAVLMAGATVVSRILGLIRDRLFAHAFGAGNVLDAYYAAFKIPDFLFNLVIMGALSAGFIPVFTKFRKEFSLEQSWPIVHSMLGLFGIVLVSCGVFLFVCASVLMHLIAPGFDTETHTLAVMFSRIMFLSPLFLGISAILGGVLQSLRQFFVFALAPILYNIGIIFGVVVLYPTLGIMGLAWGVVIGAFSHMLIQYWALTECGFTMRFSFKVLPEVKRIIVLMLPRTFGLAVNQMSLIIMTAIASTLTTGSISAFQFAHNIAFVPVGVFAVSYAVAAFPRFSEAALEKNPSAFVQHFSSTVRQVLFLMIPSTVMFVLLRAQIVRVLLGTGAFDWEDTVMTFDTLAMFAIGFVGLGLVHVLVRGFYAYEDTRTPVFVAIASECVAVGIAFFGAPILGVQALAMGISFGALFQIAILMFLLQKKIGRLDGPRILTSLYKMTVAALVMAFVMQYVKIPVSLLVDMTTGLGVFVQAASVGAIGGLTYLVVGLFLKTYEMHVFVEAVRAKFVKIKVLPDDLNDTSSL